MRIPTLLTLVLFATPALATDPAVPHFEKDDHSLLVMAKDTYRQVHHDKTIVAEPVCFDWTNTDAAWHELPSTDPWHIQDEEGKTVYGPVAADVMVPAPPGHSHPGCWHQQDAGRDPVPDGTYTLVFRYDATDIRLDFHVETSFIGPE